MMKGYAADDIYLGGETIWHWNGTGLSQLAIPSEVVTERRATTFVPRSIAADPQQRIYFGGTNGAVIHGNARTGLQVLQPPVEGRRIELRRMTWFNDALWAVNGIALYKLGKDGWERQDFLDDEDRPVFVSFP